MRRLILPSPLARVRLPITHFLWQDLRTGQATLYGIAALLVSVVAAPEQGVVPKLALNAPVKSLITSRGIVWKRAAQALTPRA